MPPRFATSDMPDSYLSAHSAGWWPRWQGGSVLLPGSDGRLQGELLATRRPASGGRGAGVPTECSSTGSCQRSAEVEVALRRWSPPHVRRVTQRAMGLCRTMPELAWPLGRRTSPKVRGAVLRQRWSSRRGPQTFRDVRHKLAALRSCARYEAIPQPRTSLGKPEPNGLLHPRFRYEGPPGTNAKSVSRPRPPAMGYYSISSLLPVEQLQPGKGNRNCIRTAIGPTATNYCCLRIAAEAFQSVSDVGATVTSRAHPRPLTCSDARPWFNPT